MNRIEVVPASPAEQPACLALLPEMRGLSCEWLIARRNGAIAGAAGLSWSSWNRPAGFPLWLHVIPCERRQGVGRSLVAAAVELAAGETGGLWSLKAVEQDSEAAAFLAACGFAIAHRSFTFRMDMVRFDAHMQRIVERLRRHGRIPAELRVVSLREAPLRDVAWMVSAAFASGPAQLLAALRRGLGQAENNGVDPDRSVVVMADDTVAGALLYRFNGGHCLIEANAVAPAWRNGCVNALQLAAATRNALTAGASSFQYDCDEDVIDSINLARRNGGERIATKALFRYALAS